MSVVTVLTGQDIARSLARIAHEIIERNRSVENCVVIGMHTRGVPLAQRLSNLLDTFSETVVQTGTLDISAYRDDVTEKDRPADTNRTSIPLNIENKTVILVDDVLYTGRSIRAAKIGRAHV